VRTDGLRDDSMAVFPFCAGSRVPDSNAGVVTAIDGFDTADGWLAWSSNVASGSGDLGLDLSALGQALP
jgi:hypothetical protein